MYHINHEGEVKKCRAFIKPCPYSKDKHFRTSYEALQEATELRTNYEFEVNNIKHEIKRLDKYYDQIEADYKDLEIVKNKIQDIVGNKGLMNPRYREVVSSILGQNIGDNIVREKGLINYFHKGNRALLFTNFNSVEAEALSDVSLMMDATENFSNPQKRYSAYNDDLQRRMRTIKNCIEASNELGVNVDKYNFEYVIGEDHPYNFFKNITVDEYGEINNMYFLGVEGQNFHSDPAKVTKIENNLLYTENHPEGISLNLTFHEKDRNVNDTARAIFYRDDTVSGKHIDFAKNKFWNQTSIEWDSKLEDKNADLKWGIDKEYNYEDSNALKDLSKVISRKDMKGNASTTFVRPLVKPQMTREEAFEDANRRLKEAQAKWPF